MELIAQDKKVKRGKLTFILARGIGAGFIAPDVDAAEVRAFLAEKLARAMMTSTTGSRSRSFLVCLLLSAFFSGSETALTASSRARMQRLEKQGNRRAAHRQPPARGARAADRRAADRQQRPSISRRPRSRPACCSPGSAMSA